mmetsp:Transcript_4311/g.6883  ORF Transcript_4311/g.6883 Transcript_4311/m.6883 type:complete len:210 (+) Transcript_4311:1205-1834(+)
MRRGFPYCKMAYITSAPWHTLQLSNARILRRLPRHHVPCQSPQKVIASPTQNAAVNNVHLHRAPRPQPLHTPRFCTRSCTCYCTRPCTRPCTRLCTRLCTRHAPAYVTADAPCTRPCTRHASAQAFAHAPSPLRCICSCTCPCTRLLNWLNVFQTFQHLDSIEPAKLKLHIPHHFAPPAAPPRVPHRKPKANPQPLPKQLSIAHVVGRK